MTTQQSAEPNRLRPGKGRRRLIVHSTAFSSTYTRTDPTSSDRSPNVVLTRKMDVDELTYRSRSSAQRSQAIHSIYSLSPPLTISWESDVRFPHSRQTMRIYNHSPMTICEQQGLLTKAKYHVPTTIAIYFEEYRFHRQYPITTRPSATS